MTAKVNYISATQASYFVHSLIGKTPATFAMVAASELRMQVWNVLRAARWKCRTQKSRGAGTVSG